MNLFENLLNMHENNNTKYSDEEMEILKACYNSPTNEHSYLDFDEWLKELEKVDGGQVLKDILYDESLNSIIKTESNKSIDELIEIAGGMKYIDEIFHEVVNEYDGIENDIDEVAEFTYDRIKGDLSLNDWANVLEYLYYSSSNLSESANKSYDIRFSFRGNGCCAYNRLEMQYGDYKNLAHISDDGIVKYYDSNLPADVKNKIETYANKMKSEYEERMKNNADAKRKNDEFLKNRFKIESTKNKVYNDVIKEIKELKNKLKDEDIVENFGQTEVKQLRDKYDWFNLMDLDQSERLKILRAIDSFDEWCMTHTTKNIKTESISKDTLWTNFNRHYNGFIPLTDLTNYFSLDQFGEFIQWCRKEADLDYDYEKRYSDWSEIYQEINDIWFSEDVESISVENVFNFFTTSDLEEFWEWVEKEYDLIEDELEESVNLKESISRNNMIQELKDYNPDKEVLVDFIFGQLSDDIIKNIYNEFVEYMEFEPVEESTSGIGTGAYTTKAIDMLPTGIKKVKESLYDEYLERVMDEKSNAELVNILHEIRDNKDLKSEDKKKLEDEIRTKVRTIKTEAITEFYGKEWTDEEIKKIIEAAKENPEVVGYIDPNECASPFNYNGKTYYAVGEGKEIVFDGKDCVVYLTVDEELNRYLSYFEIKWIPYSDGDGENGMSAPDYEINDVPYKVVEV